jgi:uncharacterized membrane protein
MARQDWVARFLGLFSIGLGIAQVAASRSFARFIGVRDNEANQGWARLVGIREIGAGTGLLATSRPAGWLAARVAGDAMDLALLGAALNSRKNDQGKVAAAAAAAAGIALIDLGSTIWFSRKQKAAGKAAKEDIAVNVKKVITVERSPEELYSFWHNFENLPRFMRHLEAVQVTGPRRSHWKAKAPAGQTVEWDAEVVEDRPNEMIAWRSLEGAQVENSGSVRFVPATGGRGTWVQVELEYDPSGGKAGALVAKLFGEEPEQQVQDDLRAFKQVVETGEVVLSESILDGGRLAKRPAQPPENGARP